MESKIGFYRMRQRKKWKRDDESKNETLKDEESVI
jgi:hypothetical protein